MKTQRNKGFGALLIIVVVALFISLAAGFYLVNTKKELKSNSQLKTLQELKKDDISKLESEEDKELNDDLSKGNSFSEIETDINNTVILEEDFSDL